MKTNTQQMMKYAWAGSFLYEEMLTLVDTFNVDHIPTKEEWLKFSMEEEAKMEDFFFKEPIYRKQY
jgi:hypothetical protein